ncbi:MAG TPA: hypothetical protein VF669_10650 [Tepidisphaeraceae bacterium]|jgi:hypothetical protein
MHSSEIKTPAAPRASRRVIVKQVPDQSLGWEVYLLERADEQSSSEPVGRERFDNEKIARRYAAELARVFDVAEVAQEG